MVIDRELQSQRMASSMHSYRYVVFRTLLVLARKSAGMTQAQVAKELNKPQSYVSKYERGERRLDFAEFIELADILQIDINTFVDHYHLKIEPARRDPLKVSV